MRSMCKLNSYAGPAVRQLATSAGASAATTSAASVGGTTRDEVASYIKAVFTALSSNANGYQVALYMAFNNDNFVLVKDCWYVPRLPGQVMEWHR